MMRMRNARKAAMSVAETGIGISTAASRTRSHASNTMTSSPSSTPPTPCQALCPKLPIGVSMLCQFKKVSMRSSTAPINMSCNPRPRSLNRSMPARPFGVVCGGLPGLLTTCGRVARETTQFRDAWRRMPFLDWIAVPKVTVQFSCTECGTTSGRWLGKCPGCGAFGTLVEELHGSDSVAAPSAAKPVLLEAVRAEESARISTGVSELDRVLGGGLVPASLVLVGGEPGVGKSTLLLTALGAIARSGSGRCS